MSFVTRLSSFARIADHKITEHRVVGIDEHAFWVDPDVIVEMKGSVPRLAELGGVQGLCAAFRTDLKNGLMQDEIDSQFQKRRSIYGINYVERAPPATLARLIWESYHDPMLIILIIAGTLSIIIGIINDPSHGWVEGAAILFSVFAVSFVTAFNNWNKERQFRAMDDQKDASETMVIRDGAARSVDSKEVNVGELMVLRSGCRVPVDAVFVTGDDVTCNEAKMTGENRAIKKSFTNPFILSGTEVVSGEGIFLAIAVGPRSEWGILLKSVDQVREITPLQIKLAKLAEYMGKGGFSFGIGLFLVLIFRDFLWDFFLTGYFTPHWDALFEILIICVTVLVVAVPEGLPLAVTITLAYSMKKMVKDNIFVRVLSACETMGNATQICSDKTGTLTRNMMCVVEGYLAGRLYSNMQQMNAASLDHNVIKLITQAISLDSKAFVDDSGDQNAPKFSGGNQTECALLAWIVQVFSGDYMAIRTERPLEKAWPFNSTLKMSMVLYKLLPTDHAIGKNKFRMHLKGAAETILDMCSFAMQADGSVELINTDRRGTLSHQVESMTKSGLRCIGMAYQDYMAIEYNEFGEVLDPAIDRMIFIGVCGLKDPVRDEVPESVAQCQAAGVVVRMVTGDHLETAKFIAKECGILRHHHDTAFTGAEFRSWNAEEQDMYIPGLRVLARSSPQDKELLVKWLMAHGEVVAVTGDGTNDAPALSASNVGLSMGIQGTDVAKQASHIIIMDDNFTSIVKAIMWGRAVYDNIRKFMQFQMTVNFVALTMALIGAFSEFKTPLKAVQLLWVNFIMDTMAALALGTENPTPVLLLRKPYRRDISIVSNVMWRNILGQSTFQLAVLVVLLFAPMPAALIDPALPKSDQSAIRLSILFNAVVMVQLFNEINSRCVSANDMNPFRGIASSPIFALVFSFTVFFQVMIIEFLGEFTQTVPLSLIQWVFCVVIGMIALPMGFLLRLLPVEPGAGAAALFEGYSSPVGAFMSYLHPEDVQAQLLDDDDLCNIPSEVNEEAI